MTKGILIFYFVIKKHQFVDFFAYVSKISFPYAKYPLYSAASSSGHLGYGPTCTRHFLEGFDAQEDRTLDEWQQDAFG